MNLREKLDQWIGDAPVRIEHMNRGKYIYEPTGAAHSAYIEVRDGVLWIESAITENQDGVTPNAFILSHDIGHFLAADDADLEKRNLGLGTGATWLDDQKRKDWERDNEERTLAYQWALLRSIGWELADERVPFAIKILSGAAGVRKDEVERLRNELTPEKVRSEWTRKLALITSMSPELACV
jgi:hypothetical protein